MTTEGGAGGVLASADPLSYPDGFFTYSGGTSETTGSATFVRKYYPASGGHKAYPWGRAPSSISGSLKRWNRVCDMEFGSWAAFYRWANSASGYRHFEHKYGPNIEGNWSWYWCTAGAHGAYWEGTMARGKTNVVSHPAP